MPKFTLQIDQSYKRIADQAANARNALRETAHQPERRATTRALFSIGIATLAGVVLIALWWA